MELKTEDACESYSFLFEKIKVRLKGSVAQARAALPEPPVYRWRGFTPHLHWPLTSKLLHCLEDVRQCAANTPLVLAPPASLAMGLKSVEK